jgi:hypothetical protein
VTWFRRATCCDSGAVVATAATASLCGWAECYCRGKPLPIWATTATSVDVVPLLKASVWRCSVQPRPPGENPRSLDRAVATLWRRTLLEDTALEFMAYGSPLVVRRRCGASWCWLFVWRSSAKLASCPSLVELPWRCFFGL